jgi:hypothetical protein
MIDLLFRVRFGSGPLRPLPFFFRENTAASRSTDWSEIDAVKHNLLFITWN